jgi:CRP-like cAMP-binding protein
MNNVAYPGEQITEALTFIRSNPIFIGVSETSIQKLVRACTSMRTEKGQFIFFQDDPADKIYFVRAGLISIFLESVDGRKLVINEMHSGDFIGEIGLLTKQSRSSSAMARIKSELFVIPHHVFMEVMGNEPILMRRLLEMIASRLRESSERESALAFLDAQGRLARLILRLSQQELEKGYITISQEELAERTGQTRQTVAKAFGRWRRAGWLITGRGRIMLLKYAELAQLEMEESI